jgi:hypothetical protein
MGKDEGESGGEQQRERHEELARDRTTRGAIRESHLESGRTQARREAAEAHEQTTAQSQSGGASDSEQPEATFE